MTKKLAETNCPGCNTARLKHIISHDSVQQHGSDDAWFQVNSCAVCGRVYGVSAKITNPIEASAPGISY